MIPVKTKGPITINEEKKPKILTKSTRTHVAQKVFWKKPQSSLKRQAAEKERTEYWKTGDIT